MKLGKSREEIVTMMRVEIPALIKDKHAVDSLVEVLHEKHNMPKSTILSVLNDVTLLENLNTIELGLFSEQVMLQVKGNTKWINEFFTDNEVKIMRVYKKPKKNKEAKRTFDAIKIDDNVFIIGVSRKDIAMLYDSGVFTWDEQVQREGVEKLYNDEIIVTPTINKSNVEEIKEQTLNGTLMANELAYNLVLGSSETGQEIYYDEERKQLTFAEDAIGQILDGFHRTLGITYAWMENNSITGMMPIRLSNYSTEEATRYQVELSKAVPLDKSRIRALNKTTMSNRIVTLLKSNSELQNKISDKSIPNKKLGQLVSFIVLDKAFNDLFKVETTLEVREIANSFNEYLVYLFGEFAQLKDDKEYFIFNNKIFYLHVYLFKRMIQENIPFSDLKKVINADLFKKNNEYLQQYGLNIASNDSIKSRGTDYVDELMIGGYFINKRKDEK